KFRPAGASWKAQRRFHFFRDGAGKDIVALESKMHVLIKKISAGNAIWACLGQRSFTVSQGDIILRLLPDNVFELAVASETQGIKVPSGSEFFLGRRDILQLQRALAAAETQLREGPVDLRRLIID